MRVLLIDDDATARRLLRQHLVTAFDGVDVVEHPPATAGSLAPEFSAAGYDAVLLDRAPGGGSGLDWLRDCRARPLFPAVIFLLDAPDEDLAAAATEAGAFGLVIKSKVDHREFATLVQQAAEQQRRVIRVWRRTPAGEQAYRFGPTVIKGMRCIRTLAASSLSSVYLAESERAGRLVVLKLLRQVPDVTEQGSTFDRFLQEYEIIRGIRHPNVVEIYELGIADDHAFIAMEYFPAGNLRTRLRRGLKPAQALGVLRQMAAALDAIHRAGILHRDIKPGNVMLRKDGTIVLIDFGLAKQLSLEAEITATGEIFGTPYYMSPEQGHGHAMDERSDIYSLGVIFYEMLCGKKPYLAPSPMAVIYKHSHSPIPTLPPGLAGWQGLLERLLAKAPEDRFQSAADVVRAIDAGLAAGGR